MQRNIHRINVIRLLRPVALGWACCAVVPGICWAGGHGSSHSVHEEEEEFASDAKIRGIELGEFRIRSYYPVQAQKSTVRFVIHAAVASEDYADAKHLAEMRRVKLRDEVIIATRMSPLTAFNDATLADFRRLLLVRLRRAVPDFPIDDIYVSDFRLTVKTL